jgi:protein-S-isoprenylcysteine O-methyltransferase Ste14
VSKSLKRVRRWFGSTSNRTFVVWPVVLFGLEAFIQRGMPVIHWGALPLLAWGYGQYKFVGGFRTREGGGGPGISIPPERIVDEGPYRFVRNPMYLRHLIFYAGMALVLGSWIAAAVFAFHAIWFDRRVREDEERLAQIFGESYREYCRRVKRWVPGIL